MNKEIPGVFHNDPEIIQNDLEKIEVLTEQIASEKWIKYVSTISRHIKQMQEDEWPFVIVAGNTCWYSWIKDWNENNFYPFKSHLKNLNTPESCVLYIFWMKEISLKTTWGVFCNNWGNFLYEDEGCILVFPENGISLILSNGSAWLGNRGTPKT